MNTNNELTLDEVKSIDIHIDFLPDGKFAVSQKLNSVYDVTEDTQPQLTINQAKIVARAFTRLGLTLWNEIDETLDN